jgi:hypothetical protein
LPSSLELHRLEHALGGELQAGWFGALHVDDNGRAEPTAEHGALPGDGGPHAGQVAKFATELGLDLL